MSGRIEVTQCLERISTANQISESFLGIHKPQEEFHMILELEEAALQQMKASPLKLLLYLEVTAFNWKLAQFLG